jgi:phenylacetate-CoA ligase
VYTKAGIQNFFLGGVNHYGTVDQGTLAYETPICSLVRKTALANKNLYSKIFFDNLRQPTLAQYLPEMFYFESDNGNLLCSAFSGLPLFRYDLKDRGGILSMKEVFGQAKAAGVDLDREVRANKLKDTIWNLPFVYLYERSDMVVSWYGGNIYPEHVREAHLDKTISKYLTGKFSMQLVYGKNHNPVLEINSELKPNTKNLKKIVKELGDNIIKTFLKRNSEYRVLHSNFSDRMVPKINLWNNQSSPHFATAGKQKWVIK